VQKPDLVVWVNGEAAPAGQSRLRADDRGLLYGDGLFETVRAYKRRVFALGKHLGRLLSGAQRLALPLQYGEADLVTAVTNTLAANELTDAYIRLTVTRGVWGRPSELDASQACTVIITAHEYPGYPARVYQEGLRLAFAQARRNETSPLAGLKTLNCLDNILEQHRARQAGYDEAIFLNTQGIVAEGATTNVFMVEGERMLTPPLDAGALPGIIRACLMERLEIVEEAFGPERLARADEVFLTNSLLEVAPATQLEGQSIGDGAPGPVYKQVHQVYRNLIPVRDTK